MSARKAFLGAWGEELAEARANAPFTACVRTRPYLASYRVHPVPPTLQDLVFDFGSLTKEQEQT